MDATNQLPSILYKAYNNKNHALDFVENGKIRLGKLQDYKTTEDKLRRDPCEGESHVYTKENLKSIHINTETHKVIKTSSKQGLMHHRGSLENGVYIFCASDEHVNLDDIRRNYGRYVVEIYDFQKFYEAFIISASLDKIKNKSPIDVNMFKVNYNRGEVVSNLDLFETQNLVSQKSREFADDHEWRFALIFESNEDDCPDSKFLILKDQKNFVRLL